MLTRRDVLTIGGGGIGALTFGRIAIGESPKPLRVVGFAGAANLPFWIGQDAGFFMREGIEPTLAITPNSVEMAENLYKGRFDLALTAIDNVVAYDEGQGEAQIPAEADFVALFGVDDGMLSVMAAPGIPSLADLKGKTVSVDALTTGFAFVLREMLAKAGLVDGDVTFVKAGGGAQRLERLLKGEQAATLLNAPLDLVAEAQGFVRLATARDKLGPYQGIVGMARRGPAEAVRGPIEAFIRGFHAALRWLGAEDNREEAASCLVRHMSGLDAALARRACDRLLDEETGIFRDLRVNRAGVETVLRLRSAYALPRKILQGPGHYIDDTYLSRALKG